MITPPDQDAVDQFIAAMPKVELHVHLEGTMRPATLRDLARKHRIDLPVSDDASLAAFYRFRDFDHFIEVYVAACECLRHPEDFARVVCELGEDAASQHIRYLEVHFNPEPHARKRGIGFTELLAGMNEGRRAARETWGVDMRWIADGVRDADSGPISVEKTVDWIAGSAVPMASSPSDSEGGRSATRPNSSRQRSTEPGRLVSTSLRTLERRRDRMPSGRRCGISTRIGSVTGSQRSMIRCS